MCWNRRTADVFGGARTWRGGERAQAGDARLDGSRHPGAKQHSATEFTDGGHNDYLPDGKGLGAHRSAEAVGLWTAQCGRSVIRLPARVLGTLLAFS